MNIDTIALQCFIAVAETGSFTRAAERLWRTQSAISQQITKLENFLGKQLLNRERKISLTPEGEIFIGYARKIVALQCELVDRFKEPELEGEVYFGLPEDFATVFLSEVLIDFLRIHPHILLNIECDLTINLFDRFKQKEFDLVLVKMNRPEDFPNGVNVLSEPLKWVGDSHVIDPNRPIPLVLAPKPCVYRASAIGALEREHRAWRIVFCSPSYAGAVAAVKAGMGITVMPQAMIPDDLNVVESALLPPLEATHVSLLKHQASNPVINTLERVILGKFKY